MDKHGWVEILHALGYLILLFLFMLSILGGFTRTFLEGLGWFALLLALAGFLFREID